MKDDISLSTASTSMASASVRSDHSWWRRHLFSSSSSSSSSKRVKTLATCAHANATTTPKSHSKKKKKKTKSASSHKQQGDKKTIVTATMTRKQADKAGKARKRAYVEHSISNGSFHYFR